MQPYYRKDGEKTQRLEGTSLSRGARLTLIQMILSSLYLIIHLFLTRLTTLLENEKLIRLRSKVSFQLVRNVENENGDLSENFAMENSY